LTLPRHIPVRIREDLMKLMLQIAKNAHPRECILLLRGEKKRDGIYVEEVLIPPMPIVDEYSAIFNPYLLPMDFSIIGLFHSHPSGDLHPSIEDLNHFYGMIMMIAAYPYESEADIAVFNSKGEKLQLYVL